MNKFYSAITAGSLAVLLAIFAPHSARAIDGGIYPITGVLIRVSADTRSVYIKNDSRIIRFQADKKLCEAFMSRIDSTVIINYVKLKRGTLVIKNMRVIREKKKRIIKSE